MPPMDKIYPHRRFNDIEEGKSPTSVLFESCPPRQSDQEHSPETGDGFQGFQKSAIYMIDGCGSISEQKLTYTQRLLFPNSHQDRTTENPNSATKYPTNDLDFAPIRRSDRIRHLSKPSLNAIVASSPQHHRHHCAESSNKLPKRIPSVEFLRKSARLRANAASPPTGSSSQLGLAKSSSAKERKQLKTRADTGLL